MIDDDRSVRRALKRLMKSVGIGVETFAAAEDFLKQDYRDTSSCLILDIRMPGMSGLELQKRLAASGSKIPIIFITAHDDPDDRSTALEANALGFFQKPFDDRSLLDTVYQALGLRSSEPPSQR